MKKEKTWLDYEDKDLGDRHWYNYLAEFVLYILGAMSIVWVISITLQGLKLI